MTAFKQLTAKDVTINPFKANKGFGYVGSAITASNVGIDVFQGVNQSSKMVDDASPTGLISQQNTMGIYNSAKQLYYSNYLVSSRGDTVPTSSIIPGALPAFNVAFGPVQSPRYENYLQSTLTQSRYFPTESDGQISIISVPQNLFGENIVPNTFEVRYTASNGIGFDVMDDGEGNLVVNTISGSAGLYGTGSYGSGSYLVNTTPGDVIGQIFYPQGMAVITTSILASMGSDISASSLQLDDFTINFSSSITIYEHQYKCMISENEFGYSLNPTLISSSLDLTGSLNDVYYDFATGSIFDPYITTVGLYNGNSDLVAVGKLSYPIPVSKYCDTTIMINFDT